MKFSLTFLSIMLLVSLAAGQDSWKKAKDVDGISIFTRNHAQRKLKEFKAEMTIEARLESVAALLTDGANYPNWVYKVGTCKRLEGNLPGKVLNYYTVSMPWPFKDRDGISSTTIQKGADGTLTISQRSETGQQPEKKDFVRLTYVNTKWILKPLDDGKLYVSYQSVADPGDLPKWLVNLFLLDSPTNTLKNLRKEIKKAAYANASPTWM